MEGADYRPPVESITLPDKVIIPLKQGFGVETHCLVRKGDRVRAGQIIGRDDHTLSSPVHSPINGVVEYFETFMEENEPHFGVVIRRDHTDLRGYIPVPGADSPYKSRETIGEILYLAGVTSLGSCGIPSFHRTSKLSLTDVDTLVVNGLSAEPFTLPQERLLVDNVSEFVIGLKFLTKLLAVEGSVHLALDCAPETARKMRIVAPPGVMVHLFERLYPLDCDEMVTEAVTGKRVPDGGTPADVGVCLVTVQDVLHVYDAVALGKPLIERVVALGGPGLGMSRLVSAPVGTPLEWLLIGRLREDIEERVLIGGAMRGRPIVSPSHPMERTFSSVTVLEENRDRKFMYFLRPGFSAVSYSRVFFSSIFRRRRKRAETNLQGEARACIYCGYCDEICPRGLVPHQLARLAGQELVDETEKYGIESCIECGLCTFVCPSKIEVMEGIRRGKSALRERGKWVHMTGERR